MCSQGSSIEAVALLAAAAASVCCMISVRSLNVYYVWWGRCVCLNRRGLLLLTECGVIEFNDASGHTLYRVVQTQPVHDPFIAIASGKCIPCPPLVQYLHPFRFSFLCVYPQTFDLECTVHNWIFTLCTYAYLESDLNPIKHTKVYFPGG